MKISNDESLRAGRIEPIAPAQSGGVKTAAGNDAGTRPGGPGGAVRPGAGAGGVQSRSGALSCPPSRPRRKRATTLVARLKTQVDSGSYHVSGADIADQIVRRAKADSIQ